MKQKSLLKTMFLLCALIAGSGSVWATDVVVTLDNIGAGLGSTANTTAATTDITATGTTDSYTLNYYQCKKQGNAILMTKSVNPYISNKTAMPGNIKSVEVFINSGAAGKTTYDCAFSTTECTSATSGIGAVNITGGNSHTFSNLTGGSINVQGKYFCITLGNANNGQVLKLVITCESSVPSIPSINANNVNIFDDTTNGSIAYTINNPVEGGEITAARTVDADTWLTVGEISSTAVAFTTTVNKNTERSTTIRLTYTYDINKTVTKDVTVTQSAPVTKYTVTIEDPTGGTLVVKQGETTVNSGDKFPEGTVLNVTATASERYKFRNWQAVDASTHTYSSQNAVTWTMTAHDVTIKANFDAREYHNATFSVNGTAGTPVEYEKSTTIVFPSDPADVEGKKFVGWVTTTITGVTDETPTFVTSAQMGDADITFYAVFADAEGDGVETVTYEKLASNAFETDATYVVGALNGSSQLALFYSYNNKVDENASWGKMSTDYANNPPLTFTLSGTASVLYAKDNNGNYLQGDVNDFRMVSESHKTAIVLGNDGKIYNSSSAEWLRYNYSDASYGLRWYGTSISTGNLAYFYKKVVDPGYTYSNYCTTVAPDTRTVVNIIEFTATSTTLVAGGAPNTTVTNVKNDQAVWTAAYTYESDNTDVATVSANGVISAVAKGTANITVRLAIDKNDADYKTGETKSKSILITVENPKHSVAFYNNGSELDAYNADVEEGEAITFPANPSAGVAGYNFIGWATAAIDGSAAVAPTTVTAANMGTADVNYYAVYGNIQKQNVTATFDASDISNLTETATRTWEDNITGIQLYISKGQRYTDGTPNTWTITSGANYLLLYKENAQMKRVEVTVTDANSYSVSKYKVYANDDDENGSDLTSSVSSSENISTLSISGNYEQIGLWANNNQVRAKKIVVDAVMDAVVGYVTSFPTTTTITISAACTDGNYYFGTFSCNKPFVVSGDIEVSEISVVDDKLLVEAYETGDVVPANTGVMVSALEGGNYVVNLSASAGTSVLGDDNFLHPSGDAGITSVAMSEAAANCLYYRLTMHDADPANNIPGTIGFWWGAANGASFSLAANKAYLAVPKVQEARMGFAFGDNTQGIDDVKRETITNDRYYNLQGQRISDIHKGGLYIVNGKKVILK